MAVDFTAQLPQPSRVTGSTPIQETTAAAIGEGLKGVSAILDVGLKHSAQQREAKVLGAVEDALSEQAQQFGRQGQGQPVPALVGEEGGGFNPEDVGFSGDQWARVDRLRQGHAQGRVSRSEFYAKTSSIVQQAIHDNPRFADSIRRRAQEVLGIAPTAAAVALEAEGQKAEADMQRAAKTAVLTAGLQRGIGDMNPDGTFNVESSILKTQRALATDAYLEDYNKLLDANIKYQTYLKNQMGGPAKELSLAERKDIEVRAFMGGEQSTGFQGSDVHFHDVVDSFFTTIPAALQANKNLSVPDQEAQILGEIGQRRLVFMGWLNGRLNQVTMSPDSKEAIRKNYLDQFAQYEDWAKGGFSNLARNVAIIKQLETRAGKQAWQVSEGAQTARIMLGEPVWASVASVMLATEPGTPGREFLDTQAKNIMDFLVHGARVASGNAQTSTLAPQDQRGGMQAVRAIARESARLINSGQSDNPERDAATFGNSQADIVNSAINTQNVPNLRGALDSTASMDAIQALGVLNKSNPEQAKNIGQGMVLINSKAAILTGQSIVQDVAAANAAEQFRTSQIERTRQQPGPRQEPQGRGQATWSVVFDEEAGVVKATSSIGEGTPGPMPPIPRTIVNKINDINRAMNANVALISEYGSPREQGMDEASLKATYMQAAGIPLVNPDIQGADGGERRPANMGRVEEGNLPIIGRKPLENPDGSMSTALTFSRRDEDGLEVLVPQVVDGVKLSEENAWLHYKMSGEHFGKFTNPEDADQYANALHSIMEEDLKAQQAEKERKANERHQIGVED